MVPMETAKEALKDTSLTAEQFKRIKRMHSQDKLMAVSIANGLELPLNEVEAALWRPVPTKTAYMTFHGAKISDVSILQTLVCCMNGQNLSVSCSRVRKCIAPAIQVRPQHLGSAGSDLFCYFRCSI